jgi:mRNA interferase RelE/StbE
MTYQVVWTEPAINTAAGYLTDDPQGLTELMDRIDDLAGEPSPEASVELGGRGLRRLHLGRYRVLYEVVDDQRIVTVIHLGRLG